MEYEILEDNHGSYIPFDQYNWLKMGMKVNAIYLFSIRVVKILVHHANMWKSFTQIYNYDMYNVYVLNHCA